MSESRVGQLSQASALYLRRESGEEAPIDIHVSLLPLTDKELTLCSLDDF